MGLVLLIWSVAAAAQDGSIENGQAVFRRDCGFCHGRDGGGGESGPDLTRSKLVADDQAGSTIGPVIRNGRPDLGMPAFHLSDQEIAGVVAFLHKQKAKADADKGGRKGVDEADLLTGNAAAGKRYFDQTCARCHSATGDLASLTKRLRGLRLEEQMLYPRSAKSTVTVTLQDGDTVSGQLSYLDEFTVALKDAGGKHRSWRTADVKYTVSSPAEAHVELLPQYTDEDVHNLVAYLETLR
ncbi:MAG TPA: c-type cytochrome [Bryobacteraceae bacterium]|nr:c-type cytochrome [Bryobacteraceae bacterium]